MVVSKVGRELYEKFFRNYTRKQWGLDPSELDATVTARVPVRTNRDDRYFTDTYQAMPLHGYTRMFENMLDHPNIKIMLNTDYREIEDVIPLPRDDLHRAGRRVLRLPLRQAAVPLAASSSTRRTTSPVYQPAPVVNYPNEHAYTRVTEFKHLTGQEHPKTSIVYEYPQAEGDPYYPVPRPENAELYQQYQALADATPGVHFVGRLATYKYYNMDQVVAQALTLFARISGTKRSRCSRRRRRHGGGRRSRQPQSGNAPAATCRAPYEGEKDDGVSRSIWSPPPQVRRVARRNISEAERWVSAMAGVALGVWALERRSRDAWRARRAQRRTALSGQHGALPGVRRRRHLHSRTATRSAHCQDPAA